MPCGQAGYHPGVPVSDRPHETDSAAVIPLPRDPRELTRCITVDELRMFLGLEKDYVIKRGYRRDNWPHLRIGREVRFAPEHVRAIVRRFARGPEVRWQRVRERSPEVAAAVPRVPGVSRRSRKRHSA